MTYSDILHRNRIQTPQTQPIPGSESRMLKNDAGGYGFDTGKWAMLDMFLLTGAEGGTYYISERKHVVRNATNVFACLKEDGQRVVERTVEISRRGRAPSNDPALFVLAAAMSPDYADRDTRRAAALALPAVARTASHLFTFLAEVTQMRGWGKFLRKAVAEWYESKHTNSLAYQMVKYQQRQGWSHRDVLRQAHPAGEDYHHAALYRYATHGLSEMTREQLLALPAIIEGVEAIKSADTESAVIRLIGDYRLTHEMVPNKWKKSPAVWEALLQDMPLFAMVRNLGAMTANGLLVPNSAATQKVVHALGNAEAVTKSRLHPIAVLKALRTYGNGRGFRGNLSWRPVQSIQSALEDTFYMAFDNIEPTGQRFVLALDVSSSMSFASSRVKNMASMTVAELAAAMLMTTVRSEQLVEVVAFSDHIKPFPVTKHDRLEHVMRQADRMNFGRTDCAQPMLYALQNGIAADAFVIYTDRETWYGNMHPVQALQLYRERTGINAKMIVVAMTATGVSIADPQDPGMLDVAGFDSSFPALLAEFVASS